MDLEAVSDTTRWNIAVCQPNQDRIACKALKTRGYDAYRPIMPRFYSNGRRECEDANGRSIFPGYLFVLPTCHGWEHLRTAPGMACGDRALLKINGRLATIAHSDPIHVGISQVRQLELSLWIVDTKGNYSQSRFKIGDRVDIHRGPWVEFCGIVEKLDGPERCAILINMLGRKVRAFVNPAHLSPAI